MVELWQQGAAHGDSMRDRVCPEGLRPMGTTCTGAGEEREEEEQGEAVKDCPTLLPISYPMKEGS